MTVVYPGKRKGVVTAPVSKSHLHRLLIAAFLGGRRDIFAPGANDSADIAATRRCLAALDCDPKANPSPVLACGESGSTLRFLAPIAAALGFSPVFKKAGRLKDRPMIEYPTLEPGVHTLAGNVSSQYVTGLLFALPLLDGESRIEFSSPLESRGYVDMTLRVLRQAGIAVGENGDGSYTVPGGQKYGFVDVDHPEGDWSGAAFWFAMNTLGSEVKVLGLDDESAQPDRAIVELLGKSEIDVSGCPDIFPVLSVARAAKKGVTLFTGTRRLKLKESDRTTAMADVLARFGVKTEMTENTFTVHGVGASFRGGDFTSFGDHRIAMSIAVGATIADGPVEIDNTECAAKSYLDFFRLFDELA